MQKTVSDDWKPSFRYIALLQSLCLLYIKHIGEAGLSKNLQHNLLRTIKMNLFSNVKLCAFSVNFLQSS